MRPIVESDVLVLTNDEGKVCSRCGKRKPLYYFCRSRSTADTYQHWCKDCHNEYRQRRKLLAEIHKTNMYGMTLADIVDSIHTMDLKERVDCVKLLNEIASQIKVPRRKRKKYAK